MENNIILQNETLNNTNTENTSNEKQLRKNFNRFGLGIFAMSAAIFVFSLIFSFLITSFFPEILTYKTFQYLYSFTIIYIFGFPFLYLITRKLPKAKVEKSKLSFAATLGMLCACMACGVVGSFISQFVINFFSAIKGDSLKNPTDIIMGETDFLINFIFVAVLPPILEELVYRKFICTRLMPYGNTTAILVSAAIFGFVHGNFFQFFYAFFLGVIFAYVFIKTGKIIYTIMFHAFINCLSVIASAILSNIDLNSMSFADISQNLASYLGLLAYLEVYYVMAIAGLVVIFCNLNKFRPDPQPDGLSGGKVAKCLFTNVGIILTLAFFVFDLTLSIVK